MRRLSPYSGVTLIELLIVVSIILILITAVITASNALRQRGYIDLTTSMLEVLDTALEQYYTDHNAFPPWVIDQGGFEQSLFGNPPTQTLTLIQGVQSLNSEAWPSEGLFYYLHRSPNSRSIAMSLSDSLLSSKDADGTHLVMQSNPSGQTFDLVRFVDAWGTTISYAYPVGAAFPVVTSAGPDKKWGTGDEIVN